MDVLRSASIRRWAVVPMMLAVLLVVSACGDEDDTVLEELEDEGTAETFVGQQLSVNGEVGEVLSPDAFVIGGDFEDLDDDGTLVVGAGEVSVGAGDLVQVTGEVFEVSASEFEEEGAVDFDGQFAIRAETVQVVSEGTLQDDVDVDDAAIGELVTVAGQVDAVIDPYGFRIAEDLDAGDGLIVIDPARTFVSVAGTAEVTGTVQPFQLEELEALLDADLDDAYAGLVDDGDRIVLAEQVEFVPDD